ncbi:hypothetical protein NM688_g6803 [Phlebia brevispora]|uniref:Uncharacterized protein n=1 Tax=Phlebia brevispora TaxID=194682 RepID=A0ACC1SC90_9APHY|nr:hypothetical protein NM688_g6803 [Phlebia brevispora]
MQTYSFRLSIANVMPSDMQYQRAQANARVRNCHEMSAMCLVEAVLRLFLSIRRNTMRCTMSSRGILASRVAQCYVPSPTHAQLSGCSALGLPSRYKGPHLCPLESSKHSQLPLTSQSSHIANMVSVFLTSFIAVTIVTVGVQAQLSAQSIAFACFGGGGNCDCPTDLNGDVGVLINIYPGYQCAYPNGACTWEDKTGALQNIFQTNCPFNAPCSSSSGCSCPSDLFGDAGVLINQFTGYQCAYPLGACTWDFGGSLQNTDQTNCPTSSACTQGGVDN